MQSNVFFLGAGFSKAIDNNYPLLAELSKIIFGEENSLFPYSSNLPENITKHSDNFEKILTYLATDFPWKNEYQKLSDKAEFIRITNKIHSYLLEKNILATQNYQKYKPLWTYILLKSSPIITLNYDLILEKNIQLINSQIENPRTNIVVYDYESQEEFYRGAVIDIKSKIKDVTKLSKQMPEILKLHGSVNWYYSNSDTSNQIYCANKDTEIENNLTGMYSPYIIPPILDKSSLYGHNILQYIWAKANEYLKNAKKIYIIGFSFPETDLAVRFLFESALSSNKNNPLIYIIDTNTTQEFKEKYVSILGNNCNFDYCDKNALEKFIKNELLKQIKPKEIKSRNNQTVDEHIADIWSS